MGKDRLHEATYGIPQHLARVHDTSTTIVGICTRTADCDAWIEARTSLVGVVEALCERHLGVMHVGTVAQELYADAGREFRRQRLLVELSAADCLCRLTEQKGEGILHFTNLALQVGCLCLHRIVVRLGALHASLLHTSQFLLELHDFPCLLGEVCHVVYKFQLLVEHHESIVHVGDV